MARVHTIRIVYVSYALRHHPINAAATAAAENCSSIYLILKTPLVADAQEPASLPCERMSG